MPGPYALIPWPVPFSGEESPSLVPMGLALQPQPHPSGEQGTLFHYPRHQHPILQGAVSKGLVPEAGVSQTPSSSAPGRRGEGWAPGLSWPLPLPRPHPPGWWCRTPPPCPHTDTPACLGSLLLGGRPPPLSLGQSHPSVRTQTMCAFPLLASACLVLSGPPPSDGSE